VISPFQVRILLHYYTTPGDAEEVLRNPPILPSTMEWFIENGLLEHCHDGTASFQITDKGTFYVREGLLSVPLPQTYWRIPEAA